MSQVTTADFFYILFFIFVYSEVSMSQVTMAA
jgi:hypothetical protein